MNDNIQVARIDNINLCYTCKQPSEIEIYFDAEHPSHNGCKVIWLCKDCALDLARKIGDMVS
jgi:hypothetical protein